MILGFFISKTYTDLHLSTPVTNLQEARIFNKEGELLAISPIYSIDTGKFNGNKIYIVRVSTLDFVEETCLGGYIE